MFQEIVLATPTLTQMQNQQIKLQINIFGKTVYYKQHLYYLNLQESKPLGESLTQVTLPTEKFGSYAAEMLEIYYRKPQLHHTNFPDWFMLVLLQYYYNTIIYTISLSNIIQYNYFYFTFLSLNFPFCN
jgi:hypothetical protein